MNKKTLIYSFIFLLAFQVIHYCIWFSFFGLNLNKPYFDDGDSAQYIGATESLIKNGDLTYYHTKDILYLSNTINPKVDDLGLLYAFRTPGFNIIHYPLRLLFNYHYSLIVFIIFQIILSAFSKVLISNLIFKITSSKLIFYSILVTFGIYYPLSIYNNLLLTESLGCSFLIISLYYLFLKSSRNNLLFSGAALALAILFRPFLFPFVFVSIIYIYAKENAEVKRMNILIFIIPIFLLFSSWTIRNYCKTNELIPLTSTLSIFDKTNKIFIANSKITKNLIKSGEWWNIESPMYWLVNEKDTRKPIEVYGDFGKINSKVLIESKRNFLFTISNSVDCNKKAIVELSTAKTLDSLNSKFSNDPISVMENRILTGSKLINHKPYNAFINLRYPLNWGMLIFEVFLSKFFFIFGGIYCIILLFKNIFKWNEIFILSLIPLSIFFLFSCLIPSLEYREMFIVEFFLLPLSIVGVLKLYEGRKKIVVILVVTAILIFSVFDSIQYIKL